MRARARALSFIISSNNINCPSIFATADLATLVVLVLLARWKWTKGCCLFGGGRCSRFELARGHGKRKTNFLIRIKTRITVGRLR